MTSSPYPLDPYFSLAVADHTPIHPVDQDPSPTLSVDPSAVGRSLLVGAIGCLLFAGSTLWVLHRAIGPANVALNPPQVVRPVEK